MTKKFLLITGIAATSLLAGGWALAQSHGHGHGGVSQGGMHGMQGQMGRGMHGQMSRGMDGQAGLDGRAGHERHGQIGRGMRGQTGQGGRGGAGHTFADPARIEGLKTELAITAAQEPAWTKYTKAIQDAAAARQTARESVDHDALSGMTPADRFAFLSKMREQRQAQFEAVKIAADELLAALDDNQKAKAREILPGIAFGPGTMRGAGLGGQQQHRH